MPCCGVCGFNCDADTCLVVVIDTDTGGTLASRRFNEDETRFINHYHSLVDTGAYPNRSNPHVECKSCRTIRYKEIQEELDYWEERNSRY